MSRAPGFSPGRRFILRSCHLGASTRGTGLCRSRESGGSIGIHSDRSRASADSTDDRADAFRHDPLVGLDDYRAIDLFMGRRPAHRRLMHSAVGGIAMMSARSSYARFEEPAPDVDRRPAPWRALGW